MNLCSLPIISLYFQNTPTVVLTLHFRAVYADEVCVYSWSLTCRPSLIEWHAIELHFDAFTSWKQQILYHHVQRARCRGSCEEHILLVSCQALSYNNLNSFWMFTCMCPALGAMPLWGRCSGRRRQGAARRFLAHPPESVAAIVIVPKSLHVRVHRHARLLVCGDEGRIFY